MIISTIILEDIKHITLNLTLQGIFYFAVAGMIHFVLGWTLLTISQNRIGAFSGSPVISHYNRNYFSSDRDIHCYK